MREGSLDAPTRHVIPWREPDYYDEAKLDAELRRVFDICHGCRRCFNLCDSFPRLFDLIDESETGELDSVSSDGFKPVVDACTLCDMCFLTKCPYVPPHEFDLDFPHLMLRYRAFEHKQGRVPFVERQLTETDRNGRLATRTAPLANWASKCGNKVTRPLLERVGHVHRDAALPRYHGRTLTARARKESPAVDRNAPAFGRKAVIYATCFANYNNPDIGTALRGILARNGVETEVVYPACCGMPQLEHGDLERVAASARKIAGALRPWVDKGYDVISLVPSCSLMMKFEWPLIEPEDEAVKALSQATFDAAEYVVDIARKEGLADGMRPLDGGVTVHIACHARAQNMGQKATDLLRLLPETDVKVIERCSGHGGSWGVMKDNFEVALKVGRPVARQALEDANRYVVSECPLARDHIIQMMEKQAGSPPTVAPVSHPIQIMARAYGL
ncbi:MAG: glycerol-3-phosphate dehydrogenase [Rhodospirillales bacterium]|nr:MAG: glycerol-3-phosphate dehydrogenase [Rhodospirillales bacterium]